MGPDRKLDHTESAVPTGTAGQGVAETEELARPTGGGAPALGAGGLAELTGVLLLRHGNSLDDEARHRLSGSTLRSPRC